MSDPFLPPGEQPAPPPPGSFPPPSGHQQPYGYQPGYQQQGYGYSYGPTYTYAGFWRRAGAAVLDGLVLMIPSSIINAAAGGNVSATVGYGFTPGQAAIANVLTTLLGVAYYAWFEGVRGQTPGKMALGLRVINQDTGQYIGIGRGIGRYFARWLSAIPILLGYFWMLWDPRKQCWHDKLVRNVVVHG
jgi:uncharacterized RDD family membrane protein YckC